MKQVSDPIPPERIAQNLSRVRQRIAEATARAGRTPDSVRLVAVTKYVTLAEVQELIRLGVSDFGESRIQEGERKINALATTPGLNWHLIGHLQTNKADKAVKLFQTVHSIDSQRVADALNKERGKSGLPPLLCLLEVNVAEEPNKTGLSPTLDALKEITKQCSAMPHLSLRGLMCMAPYSETPETIARPVFKRLAEFMAQLNAAVIYPQALNELSMGMTQDFTIAIEEGATLVRVGSALFE